MRHDRGRKFQSRRQCGADTGRPSVKRATTGIVAAVLAMSATAALAQSKPPLKLGGILDMSGLYADITGAGLGDRREDGGGGFWRRGAGTQGRDRRGRSSQQGRPCRQHRARHARQPGRRDAVRRGGVRDRAGRRRDRESAQQDRDVFAARPRSASATRPAVPTPCIMPTTRLGRPTSPGSPPSSPASRPGSSSPPTMRSARTWKRTPPMWW